MDTAFDRARKRAWKPKQVPIGALIRLYDNPKCQYTITAVLPNYKGIDDALLYERSIDNCGVYFLPDLATSIHQSYHSIDGGKTWLKCHN